jgi:pimeloyl-ACP methyl ester carboxylesterase
MRPDADLSILGVARLVAEFLEALGLTDVTLVMNDWGGAQALVADGRDQRIGKLVITSCEAFDNFPPGLPGNNLYASARMPGGLKAAFTLLKLKPMRRLPMTWGRMSKRPVPDAVMDAWFRPLWTSPEIRRDLRKYVLGVPPEGRAPALGGGAAHLRPAGARRLGLGGPGHAAGTRTPARRHAAQGRAGRDRRQLHPDPAGPAGRAHPAPEGVPAQGMRARVRLRRTQERDLTPVRHGVKRSCGGA